MTADRPSRADGYRARARECLERAEKTSDSNAKYTWKEAAAFWLKLADQADKLRPEK
jgi:hypothetical protein